MTAIKITILLLHFAFVIFCFVTAVLTPIYVTQGYYWWTALFLILGLNSSDTFGKTIKRVLDK